MEVTTSAEALRRQRAALGGSATTWAAMRLNAEQASKRVTRKPTRPDMPGRLGKRSSEHRSAGVMASTRGRGEWTQHGKPSGGVAREPTTGEGKVLLKPGNAGRGKGLQVEGMAKGNRLPNGLSPP